MPVNLALYQPDIPQNTGTLIRMSACFALPIHIIHPAGFNFSEKSFRRSAMDYADHAHIIEHDSFDLFTQSATHNQQRIVLLTTKADRSLYDFTFTPSDILMLGRESAGVPEEVAHRCDARVRLPMADGLRSLNIAIAGAVAIGEAMRQTAHLDALN